MFNFFKGNGKNKELDEIIRRVEMNVSNNYKDAAQSGLKEFEEKLKELEAAGKIGSRQNKLIDKE